MSDFSNLLSPDAYQQLNFDFCFSFNLKDLMEILFKLFSNSSNFHTILLFIEWVYTFAWSWNIIIIPDDPPKLSSSKP